MLVSVLIVALGGAAGSALRYLISVAVAARLTRTALDGFPLGTLVVNLLGCAAIGALAPLLLGPHAAERETWRLLIITGLLGGFTTFSTFGLESIELLRAERWGWLAVYVLASAVGGIALTGLGFRTVEAMVRSP
jgi:CrcB protein